ncbi:uncharacterized protein ARMOST_10112 [Armillaria ostoyae]|uniref:Uncharacterized protein n=1 Tax=Armillaria ostoyae TaxID=47428 RepID=A0A284RDF3_ARMOS|nr:uncharacterized protein ARMOST_10112 [Armillaria ostoyae]
MAFKLILILNLDDGFEGAGRRDTRSLRRQKLLEDEVETSVFKKIDILYHMINGLTVQKILGLSLKVFNPSRLINNYILDSYPDASQTRFIILLMPQSLQDMLLIIN